MRGATPVVGTRPVVVKRLRAVGVGAGVACVCDDDVSALGFSGAAGFWMWVAAKALMPVNVVNVIPAMIARSAVDERMIGEGLRGRAFM